MLSFLLRESRSRVPSFHLCKFYLAKRTRSLSRPCFAPVLVVADLRNRSHKKSVREDDDFPI